MHASARRNWSGPSATSSSNTGCVGREQKRVREPTVSPPSDHWMFPFWALWLLLSILATPLLLGALLGLYFRVGWRQSYSELAWRVRLWFVRRPPRG